jgi:hypothetical protein
MPGSSLGVKVLARRSATARSASCYFINRDGIDLAGRQGVRRRRQYDEAARLGGDLACPRGDDAGLRRPRFCRPEYDIERKWREARRYQTAPISTNLILAYIGQHVLGMPRSYCPRGDYPSWRGRIAAPNSWLSPKRRAGRSAGCSISPISGRAQTGIAAFAG